MEASLPYVALLTQDETQARNIRELLREYIELKPVENIRELLELLETTQVEAVFCNGIFNPSLWRDGLSAILARHPDLPVIVFSGTNGEREWSEVLESGGFDLLAPPYEKRSVLAVVEHALSSRESRRWQATGFSLEEAS